MVNPRVYVTINLYPSDQSKNLELERLLVAVEGITEDPVWDYIQFRVHRNYRNHSTEMLIALALEHKGKLHYNFDRWEYLDNDTQSAWFRRMHLADV